jgi:predicted ATP-grasp superfamily ATP-dependent carboligase
VGNRPGGDPAQRSILLLSSTNCKVVDITIDRTRRNPIGVIRTSKPYTIVSSLAVLVAA